MGNELKFLTAADVIGIHDAIMAEYPGADGSVNMPLLESAVLRAPVTDHYLDHMRDFHAEHDMVIHLAVEYAFGIIRNHPFADGNKRTAIVATETFIELNGFSIAGMDDQDLFEDVVGLAAGNIDRDVFEGSIRDEIQQMSV